MNGATGRAGSGLDGVARVLDAHGMVVGSGFLLTEDTLLTCAHVVTAALGGEPTRARPTDVVRVDLPQAGQERDAEVLPGGWLPAEPDGGGDLAVLSLLGPPIGVVPPRLEEGVADGTVVRVAGYPGAQGAVVSARARVVSALPRSWALDPDRPSSPWDARGFSGAPVLSETTGGVVGIVTTTPRLPSSFRALVLPTKAIAECWPPLSALSGVHGTKSLGTLAPRDAGAIVDALLDVPDLADRRLRGLYAEMMAERAGRGPDIGRSDDTRRELWSLVLWCARRADGFQWLLEAMKTYHPASVELEFLTERVRRIVPPPLLTETERDELLALAERCGREGWERALRQGTGSAVPRLRGTADDFPALLRELEDATTGPGGDHPLTGFVARLAAQQDAGLSWQLQAWLDAFVRRTGLSLPSAPVVPDARRSYLTIQFEEDGLDPDRYLMSVRFEDGDGGGGAVLMSDELIHAADAEHRVAQAVLRAEREIAGVRTVAPMVIEFVLPLALMNLPVEYWRVGAEEPEVPIAVDYEVVIRSLERLREHRLHRRLRERWNAALQASEPALRWAGHGDRRELREAIREGNPAVVWVRGRPDPRAVDDLHDFLDRTRLTDLPRRVAEFRRRTLAGARPDAPLGLGLLYDDPDRLVGEAMQLRIPEASEETA
ncbi:VMAP-C domain-containing protein [Streptomyces sp. 7R007]